jgi:hypothetical protein
MFIPLTHTPGEAQVDFGEALMVMAVPRQNIELLSNQVPELGVRFGRFPCKTALMLRLLRLLVVLSTRNLCSRRDLVLENLALRQQLGVLKQKYLIRDLQFLTDCSGLSCGGFGPAGGGH